MTTATTHWTDELAARVAKLDARGNARPQTSMELPAGVYDADRYSRARGCVNDRPIGGVVAGRVLVNWFRTDHKGETFVGVVVRPEPWADDLTGYPFPGYDLASIN